MISNTLTRGIRIIEKLAIEGPLSTEHLYEKSMIPRSSIYRLLCTLEELGYVLRTREGAEDVWRLDLKFLYLCSCITERIDLRSEVHDILIRLADDTKEIVQLSILQKNKVLILDVIKRHKSLISVANIGELLDINICAAGLVLTAYLEDKKIDDLLKNTDLHKHTELTVTDPLKFKSLLQQVKENGYSLDDQYYAIGHRCIGVPVFDYTGKVIAAINISGHIKTLTDERIEELADCVKKYALEASKRMGYTAGEGS
jgi:IclR family KDG regulon transcriptional repressor